MDSINWGIIENVQTTDKNLIPFVVSDVAILEGEINLGKRLIISALSLDEGASDLEERGGVHWTPAGHVC